MKLAIAGFGLESVTFLPDCTTVDDFERTAIRGAAVIEQARGTNSVLGGMIRIAQAEGVALEGILYANAGAAASASDCALEKYQREIVVGLDACRDSIDGCLLFLHGALATPLQRRADATILAAIRATMGADFPIAVGMDLHGNIGTENLAHASVIAGYYYSPHTDMAATGERAARLLIRSLRAEINPVMAIHKPGIILPSVFSATALEPLAELIRDARRIEADNKTILDISIFCGFAYADVPDCGMSVVVVSDADASAAARVAQELSDKAWSLREALFRREIIYSVDTGLERAQQVAQRTNAPVCLLEQADRLNDSTYTLHALRRRGVREVYAPFMFDPEFALACCDAGAGAVVELPLAGKSSPEAGGPIAVKAEVLWADTKRYKITGPLYTDSYIDLGATALIRFDGIMVSVISIQWSAIDLDCFSIFDLDAASFRYILLRSKTHFRHIYEALCAEIVIIDTPDWGPADVTRLPYEFADRRAFPLATSEHA